MATITVRSLDELYQALAQANGGETIALAGGNYGDLFLAAKSGFSLSFPGNVTITSADPGNPAIFSGMDIRDVSNLTFDGITFDYEFATGDALFNRPFQVTSSNNITIRNSTFDGDVATGVSEIDDGYGYGFALGVRDSSGVTLENNEVFEFYRGFVVSDSNDVDVRANDIHTIRMDGLNFSQIDGVVIADNYLHDFNVSPNSLDHRDMIQFWTNGTTEPSRDILITGNHLDIGTGGYTQSIFMRNDQVDRGLAGPEMFYVNVEITNNIIVNAHQHGITLGETDGVIIRNNTVLHADGDNPDGLDNSVEIPRITVAEASKNVQIIENITSAIGGYANQADWTISSNAFVQDQDASALGYYGDVFVGSSLQMVDGMHAFVALPGGMIDTLNAGAAETRAGVQGAELMASFHIKTDPDNPALRSFDASTTTVNGEPLPEGTTYVWSFGDGQIGTGARVNHTYSDGGAYNVALTIRMPDGRSDRIETPVDVAGAALLDMRVDGHFTNFEAGVETAVNVGGAATPDGIRLGVDGLSAQVERQYVDRLIQTDEFRIDMSLKADVIGTKGEVFRLHGTIVTSVTNTGELSVLIKKADGTTATLTTDGAGLSDGQEHAVSLSLKDGVLSALVDGAVLGTMPDVATLGASGTQDLVFGNPWGKENFTGMLTDFSITTDASDYGASITTVIQTPETPETPVLVEEPQVEGPIILAETDLGHTVETEPEVVVTAQADLAEGAVQLGDPGVAARFEREDISFLPGAEAFDISLSLEAEAVGTSGEVFRLQNSLLASVNQKGELVLRAFTTDGIRTKLVTEDADLNDGLQHDISISLADGLLSISVDGAEAVSTMLEEPLGDRGRQDLLFGNPRGRDNFEGTLLSFEASAPATDGAPEGPAITLDTVIRSDAPSILADVLKPEPTNQSALPTMTTEEDGMQADIGAFEAYYHDLNFFYS